ncbi:MAG TPA: DUF4388 domain-containing protein [Thermoanaerobaculia bacterium]|jgi:hypothetical protein|nr:DUF4388 domain-containing protein [Thermoanaerobaculia bacterium]
MLEGEIRDIDLVARLVELWREKFTGAIRFENDGIIKIIYFKSGDVLSASTNDRADSVDEILMRAEKVSREHVKQALAKRKEAETLGDTLLNLGFITRKELTWARRVQVVGVIRSIAEWGAGSFTIVADYLPKRDEGTIFPLPQIIVEMVVTDQDRQKFEKLLESGSAVFSKAPGFDETFQSLGFNEEAEAVVAQVDGVRTASEVAAASRQETFNAYKLLHALSLLGLLTRAKVAAPSVPVSTGTFEKIGVPDAADAWSGPMPQFDLADEQPGQETAPLRTPTPPPLPPLEPMAPPPEPQFGFDDAQIDIAQKASVPPAPPPKPTLAPTPAPAPRPRDFSSTMTATRRPVPPKTIPKKRLSFGALVAIMAVFIIAGISWYGFTWWRARNATPVATPVKRAMHKPSVAPAIPPAVTATTATTASVAPAIPPAVTPPPPTTTTRAAAIGGATQQPPQPTSDRERYEAMAREFAAAPSGKFTVQFEIVCEASNITKALRAGGTNVWFVPITLKGRSCYRVFWGHYPTREAAERGMSEIPATLREAKPSVIPVPQS